MWSLVLGLLLIEQSFSVSVPLGLNHRQARSADDKESAKTKEAKKDLSLSETRVDPYLYERGNFLDGHVIDGAAYGAAVPIGAGIGGPHLAGPYGPGLAGPAYGGGLIHRPIVPPYIESGYNGGLVKSGINEGALALGNKGEQIFRQRNDGGYSDGSYHSGGGLQQGGYHGGEGYKDNKHHLNDDHSNHAFYNGVHGGRTDLGNGQVYDKNQGYSQNAYNTLGDNELKGHQKGHHRTGFRKSYHKDESGNDESYYDSDHDQGNHEIGKKYGDQYGQNYVSGSKGGQNLKEYSQQDQGRGGFEGNGKLFAQNQGFKDYYGNNGYYNNGNKYGQLGGGGSSQIDKFGLQHGYQNGFNNGKNYENFQNAKFGGGGGYYGPYGY